MCLAIPYKVLEVKENCRAEIEVAGTRQEISVHLFPELKVGDYILVNLGFAVVRMEEEEAMEVLRLYREIAEAETALR
jgi:hydrogenase expression/formation protein HypC